MSRVMYRQEFFATEADARQFIKKQGYGALYKNTPRSHSRKQFLVEVAVSGLTQAELGDKNYCVAWNQRIQ